MGPLRSVVGAPRVPHVVSASSRASLSLRARWGRALVSRRGPLCLVFVLTAFTWESVSARVVVSDHGPRYSRTADGRGSSHRLRGNGSHRCGSSSPRSISSSTGWRVLTRPPYTRLSAVSAAHPPHLVGTLQPRGAFDLLLCFVGSATCAAHTHANQ